jgi:hypothetical protein
MHFRFEPAQQKKCILFLLLLIPAISMCMEKEIMPKRPSHKQKIKIAYLPKTQFTHDDDDNKISWLIIKDHEGNIVKYISQVLGHSSSQDTQYFPTIHNGDITKTPEKDEWYWSRHPQYLFIYYGIPLLEAQHRGLINKEKN